jgi:hypothetical protein
MPNPGDGFTVISAMRHSQPNALYAYPAGQRLPRCTERHGRDPLEADEIIVKPFEATRLKPTARSDKESVAASLQRCANDVVEEPESIPQLRRRERIHRFRRCRRPGQDAEVARLHCCHAGARFANIASHPLRDVAEKP